MKRRNQKKRGSVAKERSRSTAKKKEFRPKTSKQFFAAPEELQEIWNNVAHVISRMRADRISLRRAALEFGLDPRVVIRIAGSSLRKRSNGRYETRDSDRLLRVLMVPTHNGTAAIAVRDSRQATLLAEYWETVHKYLQTGDASGLSEFKGKYIKDANGKRIPLLTSIEELNRLGNAGVLSFESLYARTA